MKTQTYFTYDEIKSQTAAWAQAIDVASSSPMPRADDFEQVIFTGCGSTYYLSIAAASLYQELTGRSARAVPGGELWLNPRTIPTSKKALLVAISRSGTTTETVRAVEKFKADQRGVIVVISNYEQTLARLADVSMIIDEGQEHSVAQTRSFASMYVAAAAFCARTAGRSDLLRSMQSLPEAGERLFSKYEAYARDIGENMDLDRFYFLGSGIRYGLACELNLKMKEMTLTHGEPYHFLEFRHGPMSMVNEHALVAGLLSESNRLREAKVLSEMEPLGAKVVSLGESDANVVFASGIQESMRAVLYLPVLQLVAFYRSLAKGLNPDRPNNLTAVVKLDI